MFLLFGVAAHADDRTACRHGKGSTVFLLDCLNTMSQPDILAIQAYAKKHNECVQNSKNKKLKTTTARNYVNSCIYRNDAEKAYFDGPASSRMS
jgi:hypothetical protein